VSGNALLLLSVSIESSWSEPISISAFARSHRSTKYWPSRCGQVINTMSLTSELYGRNDEATSMTQRPAGKTALIIDRSWGTTPSSNTLSTSLLMLGEPRRYCCSAQSALVDCHSVPLRADAFRAMKAVNTVLGSDPTSSPETWPSGAMSFSKKIHTASALATRRSLSSAFAQRCLGASLSVCKSQVV
jgi:hypothetical protein